MEFKCTNCKKIFKRRKSKPVKNHFCSKSCYLSWQKLNAKRNTCKLCGASTKNNKYCSRTCSAKDNNSVQGACATCGIGIPKANKYCESCREEGIKLNTLKRSNWIYTTTIKDILSRNKGQQANNYRQIRDHARSVYSKNNSGVCEICGYSLHYDVCHIKSIQDFDLDTTIDVVNAPENLIGLCKNHHWELDNGHLKL